MFTAHVCSTTGGYVFRGVCLLTSVGGGYPSQVRREGGYPARSGGGVPWPGQDGRIPKPGQERGYPGQVRMGRGTQASQDRGYPGQGWGTPIQRWSTNRTAMRYPLSRDRAPPSQGCGTSPSRNGVPSIQG